MCSLHLQLVLTFFSPWTQIIKISICFLLNVGIPHLIIFTVFPPSASPTSFPSRVLLYSIFFLLKFYFRNLHQFFFALHLPTIPWHATIVSALSILPSFQFFLSLSFTVFTVLSRFPLFFRFITLYPFLFYLFSFSNMILTDVLRNLFAQIFDSQRVTSMFGFGHLKLTLIDFVRRDWKSLSQSLQPKVTNICNTNVEMQTNTLPKIQTCIFSRKISLQEKWEMFQRKRCKSATTIAIKIDLISERGLRLPGASWILKKSC